MFQRNGFDPDPRGMLCLRGVTFLCGIQGLCEDSSGLYLGLCRLFTSLKDLLHAVLRRSQNNHVLVHSLCAQLSNAADAYLTPS